MNPLKTARKGRIVFFHFFLLSLILETFAVRAQILNETILHSFTTNSTDGNYPIGGIIKGQDGSLYGTANYGGTNGYGLVFQINRNGSNYHVLRYSDFPTGAYPGSLLQWTNGLLYGTTTQGGSNSYGTVFKMNTNGTGYIQLHAFSQSDGAYPDTGFFQATNGVLYGVTSQGGISNAGTVFRLSADGTGFQMLHQFTNSPDGSTPSCIILGVDDSLYGTTYGGGVSNAGTVFKMNTNGNNYAILRVFTNSPDGANPSGNLIQGKDGMLYGTTVFGGTTYIYGGTLFKIDPSGANYLSMHSFPSVAGDGTNPESIIQGSDGFLYGVGSNGGASSSGMVFKIDTNGGNYTVIFGFAASPPDGRNPNAPLVEGGDGAFYGTADHGGKYDQGIVFRLTPPLTLSVQLSSAAGTNKSILSWPAWADGYGVRTSLTLNSNATWTPLSASVPVTVGSKLYTTNQSIAPSAFFRLQTPP